MVLRNTSDLGRIPGRPVCRAERTSITSRPWSDRPTGLGRSFRLRGPVRNLANEEGQSKHFVAKKRHAQTSRVPPRFNCWQPQIFLHWKIENSGAAGLRHPRTYYFWATASPAAVTYR